LRHSKLKIADCLGKKAGGHFFNASSSCRRRTFSLLPESIQSGAEMNAGFGSALT
jgi:hypothetical protein